MCSIDAIIDARNGCMFTVNFYISFITLATKNIAALLQIYNY